jgi:pimeloyl-ACP methyl ester carboxylesterase
MKNIYAISGLGADERAFFKTNFGSNNVIHLPWQQPLPKESIEDYALRLSKKIVHENPILVGLSFGGMMAIEIAKHVPLEKVILISSAKTRDELPAFYRNAGKIKLHKLIPVSLLKSGNRVTNFMFSTRTKNDKKILSMMIKESNTTFIKWAVDVILNWQNKTVPQNTVHIHGTKDRILPYKNIKNVITVNAGPHLMLITKAVEVNKLLLEAIGV